MILIKYIKYLFSHIVRWFFSYPRLRAKPQKQIMDLDTFKILQKSLQNIERRYPKNPRHFFNGLLAKNTLKWKK
jgi:hypothetical protein